MTKPELNSSIGFKAVSQTGSASRQTLAGKAFERNNFYSGRLLSATYFFLEKKSKNIW
jgi:hypothetical protein